MKRFILGSVALLALTTFTASASAVELTWNGSGASGQDPLGHDWVFNSGGWGIPGPGNGVVPWLGNDWISDFHITFDLPQGVAIDNGIFVVEPFSGAEIWQSTIMNNTIWFIANDATQILDPGQNFFVNVAFNQAASDVNFVAEYTMTVPQPLNLVSAAWESWDSCCSVCVAN